ncbi:MAG: hypothetical protein IJB52_02270 [Clostridia bacterium]|nr:hypothetical protein [Clostridia bacterium]
MTRKLFILLLAALLTASAFTGCGAGTENTETTPIAAETTPVETEPETAYIDTLEERDLEGYTYRMVAQHSDTRQNFALTEEMTGEVLQDAILQRKQATMERLNIEIDEIAYEDRSVLQNDVAKTIRAGDDAYDIILTALSAGINTLTMQNCLLDLNTIPHLTLESERWNASMAEHMRIDGRQYFTTGVTAVSYLYTPQTVLFNLEIAEDNNLPDLYETVLEGKWTLDTMQSMMQNIAVDLNGDGVMKPQDDRYAMLVEGTFGNALYMAAGFQCVYPDDNGNWKLHIADANSVDFIEKCAAIFSDPNSVYTDENSIDQPLYEGIFTEGRSLFISATIRHAVSFREMESNFGVLPIPVVNEGDPYLVSCNTWLPSGIGVPVTNGDPERTGLIMETMAAYSYDYILPAIMEKTLGKTARDAQSYQIMMMMYENTAFDFNTIMDFGTSSALLRGSVIGARKNFVSSYASLQTKAEKALEEFIASCRGET